MINVAYAADIRAAQLGSILQAPELQGGTVAVNGQAKLAQASLSSQGRMVVRDLVYATRGFRLAGLIGGADFTATEKKVTLPHIFLNLFGGSAVGSAEIAIAGWPSAPATAHSARTPGAAAKADGTIRLQAHDLLLPRLVAAFASPSLPLDRLKLAARANGLITANWQWPHGNLTSELNFDLSPAHAAPGELPVGGQMRARYNSAGGQLTLTGLDLFTPGTRLSASGTVSAYNSDLQGVVATHDLDELSPVLAALGGPGRLPLRFDVHGNASFAGKFTGRLEAPRIAGRLEIGDFESLGSLKEMLAAGQASNGQAANGQTGSHVSNPIHWDKLTAEVEYSPSLLAAHHGILRRGPAEMIFDVAARADKGRLTENSLLAGQLSVHQAEVGELLNLAGYEYPVRGALSGNMRLAGTLANLRGDGNLLLENAEIEGEPVQRAHGDVHWGEHEVQVNQLSASVYGGTLAGSAAYNLQSGVYNLDLQGTNLKLAKMRRLQGDNLSVAGRLTFTAKVGGTGDAPVVNGTAHFSGVFMNGERVGGLQLSAATAGDTLQLVGLSEFDHSDLRIAGTVRLRDQFPAKIDVQLRQVDVDPVLRMFLKGELTGHSSTAGSVIAMGPLRSPRDLVVTASLDQFNANVEKIPVHSEGPLRFTLAQRILRIEQFHMAGSGTAVGVSGAVQLAGNRALDLNANGSVNLQLLEGFDPSIVAHGVLTAGVHIRGTVEHPLIDGDASLSNAGISQLDLPSGLSELNGRLLFREDRLQVQSLTGKTGGGTVRIDGSVTYNREITMNLTAKGHDLRLRYPPGVSAMADADLRLTGSPASVLLSGNITVTRFTVSPQFDFASYLAGSKQPAASPNPVSALARVRLDMHIMSANELQFQTSLAKMTGDLDLRLRGNAARPALLGRVNILEGELSFSGTKYRLDRCGISFTNPVEIQPVLDVEATTTVRDHDITLGFHGPINRLSTTYRSDPPLANADIVSLLAFGRTRQETAEQTSQSGTVTPEAQSILYQALNAAVSSRMQRLFGVSRVKIAPQTSGTTYNGAGPRLTIEQQVANNLTLTYITDVARANYQTIQAEYNVSRNVSVVAVRDWNGVVSFDVRIRQRKR